MVLPVCRRAKMKGCSEGPKGGTESSICSRNQTVDFSTLLIFIFPTTLKDKNVYHPLLISEGASHQKVK